MTEYGALHELLYETKHEWMYPIYVPSYRRAGKSPLLKLLAQQPAEIRRLVYIVCRASESKAYRQEYPWATIVEQRVPWGIGPARMVCLMHADMMKFTRIVMMDDDITRVQLLEDRSTPDKIKSGRFSRDNTDMGPVEFFGRNLELGCKMADAVFHLARDVAYGSTRSAFMSSDVDVSETATIDARGFPLCVLFINTKRFTMRRMPAAFQYEGEDLAMFLHAYEEGKATFLFNSLVFDDDRNLETTIPMSGVGEIDRSANLMNAQKIYRELGPYLRVTNMNKLTGAVKRIGVDWRKYHKERGTNPTHILEGEVLSYIEGEL